MVGKIEVIFAPNVILYLDDLVNVLYKREYFGFIESAEEFVSDIYDAVPERIKNTLHNKTPASIQYLGLNYVFYKVNARTTWYIFFEKRDQNYFITTIINNNSSEVKEL